MQMESCDGCGRVHYPQCGWKLRDYSHTDLLKGSLSGYGCLKTYRVCPDCWEELRLGHEQFFSPFKVPERLTPKK